MLKKAVMLAIIILILQNYDVANLVSSKLPMIQKYISGKELFVNFIIITTALYMAMHFSLI